MNLNIHKRCVNTVHFAIKKCAVLVLFFILAPSLHAQNFEVTAVPTDETCNGTGSLTLSHQFAQPGATVNYIVYYLGTTGTDTPVIVHSSSSPNVPGQQDGVYKVEAHQFVGGNEILPFAENTTNIADNTTPLNFTATGTNILCGNDGKITVNVTSGTAVSYEIVPNSATTVPQPQTSNVFTGLAHNIAYNIIVTDTCGESTPQSLTLFQAIPNLTISNGMFPDMELAACDKLTIRNDIASTNGVVITYPLEAKFTVTHYDGSVNVYNITIAGGELYLASAQTVIDYHYGENCTYVFEFTDTCGTVKTSPVIPIHPVLTVFGEMVTVECNGRNIKYTPVKFMGPFTLEFINPPPGFNPADFNDQYPGPYVGADVPVVFGSPTNPLPVGFYTVKIHDACNRTPDVLSNEIEIEIPEVETSTEISNQTCTTDGVVTAYNGLPIGEAYMVSGPPEYSTTYDVDLDAFIQNKTSKKRDKVIVGGLPPGEYSLVLIDTCGRRYEPVLFTIKPFDGHKGSTLARPDCEEGFGTVQVSSPGFSYIEIIAAPTAFSNDFPLPYDVSEHINPTDGQLYMDHLPPGQYKFKGHNDCDDDIEIIPPVATVPAYKITADEYKLIPHCGSSFDLFFNHQSTGTAFVNFALQKWDPAAGKWSHPGTGTPYEEGDALVISGEPATSHTALKLVNNTTNFNLLYSTGTYRIIKQNQAFGDGAKDEKIKLCSPTLYEFDFYSELEIFGAISLDCTGSSGDVLINAFGVPPLNFSISEHNGDPYVLDNGDNNTFSGLISGVYKIRVSDSCGMVKTLTFNVADIPSLVYVPEPADLDSIAVCDEGGDGKETFDISGYIPVILDGQDPDDVTITFHLTKNAAEQNIDAIPDPANVTTGPVTIYARATHDLNVDCSAITWFDLIINPQPDLTMSDKWGGCEGQDVTIVADSGFDYYEWETPTGAVITGPEQITVSETGMYTLKVKDDIGCEGSKTIEVVKSPVPHINTVMIEDWTDHENMLTVVMEPTAIPGNYEYSLDNKHFQSSPVFNGLAPGQYTVYVRDEFGCGDDKFSTYILTYPKFFTPNGDNINEYWRIYLASLEPDMLVYIYDRFGKLIIGFDAKSKGWDGTLEGSKLPATDYWFVVKRQNGEELKGHFSMIR